MSNSEQLGCADAKLQKLVLPELFCELPSLSRPHAMMGEYVAGKRNRTYAPKASIDASIPRVTLRGRRCHGDEVGIRFATITLRFLPGLPRLVVSKLLPGGSRGWPLPSPLPLPPSPLATFLSEHIYYTSLTIINILP